MADKWKCTNCGGTNPKARTTCVGCEAPYVPPEAVKRQILELERQKLELKKKDIERLHAFISSKANETIKTTWEYCFIITGLMTAEEEGGILMFLSDGDSVNLGKASLGVAFDNLGKTGWELIETVVTSDFERQYPTKNLRPQWSYMLDAVFNLPPREAIYAYETIRETDGLFFIFKRPKAT